MGYYSEADIALKNSDSWFESTRLNIRLKARVSFCRSGLKTRVNFCKLVKSCIGCRRVTRSRYFETSANTSSQSVDPRSKFQYRSVIFFGSKRASTPPPKLLANVE